ncbi:MAG: hypothetical protein U1E35_04710 [Rhodospirillales bacterium]
MTTEIKVPALGESVSEATVAVDEGSGDAVAVDEPLVELKPIKSPSSPVAGGGRARDRRY